MIAYGRNTVIEALRSNFEVTEIFLQEGINFDEKISQIIRLTNSKQIKINHSSLKALTKLVKSDEHQGCACNVNFHTYKLKDLLKNFESLNSFIYISEATYEHNIGAIIRTAECAGLSGVIIPHGISITPTVIKISTGAIFHIPIIQNGIFPTIKELKDEGFNIIGIERLGQDSTQSKINYNNLFIIGGEDKSLSEQVRSQCDLIVELPQFGMVNSLNMSVASGIVIYEYLRQNINELRTSH